MTGLADSLIARMVAQRDLLREMDDRLASVYGHAVSPDDSVSVEVDGLGAMTELWLAPEALEYEPDALATLIVNTAREAARFALRRQDSLIGEMNERMRTLQEAPVTCWDGTTVEAAQQESTSPPDDAGCAEFLEEDTSDSTIVRATVRKAP
jgi:DNA-binding protein YbaB